MSNVPPRSALGCLTCKQRRKKCDEIKPYCGRCTSGGFVCLGYSHSVRPRASSKRFRRGVEQPEVTDTSLSYSNELVHYESRSGSASSSSFSLSPTWLDGEAGERGDLVDIQWIKEQFGNIPKIVSVDPVVLSQMTPLIVSHFSRASKRAMFRSFSEQAVETALTYRANNSNISRWTMYVAARVMEAVMERGRKEQYAVWVELFYRQIVESSASPDLGAKDLLPRLSGLFDLYFCAVVLLSNAKGYALFKHCGPIFLQLAIEYPRIWTPNFTISMRHVQSFGAHDMVLFVFFDTMAALALGVPPLVDYDTCLDPVEEKQPHPAIEWTYGCPPLIVLLLAKINSWRVSGQGEWKQVEKAVMEWAPTFEREDASSEFITRMAVQESWRQAVLIYLYMGMCGADSADPRVQASVRQIVQLMGTVEPTSPLDRHFFMPCLIAGAAARHEKHRAAVRNKIRDLQDEKLWVLRGDNFVPVLDHLWHGVGAGGSPTTWDDYVGSRCVALPLDG